MLHRIRLVLIVSLLTLVFPQASADQQDVNDWTLSRTDGTPFQLADNAGSKPTLILFWATWCPYCKSLMPHLESMVLEHGSDAFEVAAITIGEDGNPDMFLRKQGYDFTLLPDGDEVAKRYGIRGTPGVLIFDRDGNEVFDLRDQPTQSIETGNLSRREVAARRGPFWAAQIRKALDAALATPNAAEDSDTGSDRGSKGGLD